MTLVVAEKTPDGIYMMSDKISCNEYTKNLTDSPKIFWNDDYLIASARSWRMIDILRYCKLPKFQKKKSMSFDKFLKTSIIEEIRKIFDDSGIITEKNKITTNDGDILFCFRNDIYEIQSDFSAVTNENHIYAIGSGINYATGVMDTLNKFNKNLSIETKLKTTIEMTSKFSQNVSFETSEIYKST